MKKRPHWLCRCGARVERTKRKCPACQRQRPKPRVPAHAKTLRDHTYEMYEQAARLIHGVGDERCCVCGKPRHEDMRHHRDHGHLKGDPAYGRPRGIACFSCNRLMPRELDARRAELVAAYLRRVEDFYLQENVRQLDRDEFPGVLCDGLGDAA